MRPLQHLTARYVRDRVSQSLFERRNPELPWFTRDMIAILDSWLRPQDHGLEWGSGRSTRWLANRMAMVTSIEHHSGWFQTVSKSLIDSHLTEKTDLQKRSADSAIEYAGAADQFDDASLDFCLVDGIFRDECAIRALPKLRSGGVILVDDSQRYLRPRIDSYSPEQLPQHKDAASPKWVEFANATASWRCIWTTNGVSDTALWIKP